MDTRTQVAAMAMQGLISKLTESNPMEDAISFRVGIAVVAVEYADALLAELDRTKAQTRQEAAKEGLYYDGVNWVKK